MDSFWTVSIDWLQIYPIKNPRKRLAYEGLKLGAGAGFEPATFRL